MRAFRWLVAAALVAACGDARDPVGPGPAEAPRLAGGARVVPGEYVVVFRRDVADAPGLANRLVAQHRGTMRFAYRHALRGFAAKLPPQAVDALRRHPHVAYVEPDVEAVLFGAQADPPSWGLDRVDQRDLPLDRQFAYDTDGAGVNAYVLDTGVRVSHADFGGRAQVVPNGANGDFVGDGHGSAADCHGHGTHVAGTIGGASHGVAKGVSLWAARVVDCTGDGQVSMAIAAVDWITANAPRPAVVNMSLGYGDVQSLRDAVEGSVAAGVHFAVAAGNGGPVFGFPQDACRQSPAGAPGALTVGATDVADREAFFSNYGPCVDLLAPGVEIVSAGHTADDATRVLTGTSMATPHVAGALALHLSAEPGDTPGEAAQALLARASPGRVALHGSSAGNGTPNLLLGIVPASAPPTLVVALSATPAAGDAPLTTSLAAVVGGSATGPLTVRLWWSCAEAGTDAAAVGAACGDPADPAVGAVFQDVAESPPAVEHVYAVGGTFTPKVIVERAPASPAEARASVEVETRADLAVTTLTAPAAVAAGAPVSVSYVVANVGSDPAPSSVTAFHLSTNSVLGPDDAPLGERPTPSLAPGETRSDVATLTLPAGTPGGTWYVIAKADGTDAIPEPNESNNRRWRQVKVGPDLDVTSLTVPTSAAAGSAIAVTHVVKNQGAAAAAASVTRFWLSANSSVGTGDVPLGEQPVATLGPGVSVAHTTTVTIPAGTPGDTWYLIAEADGLDAVAEAVESNNTYARQVRVGPDLTVTSLTAAAAGATLMLTYGTRNQGLDPAPASTTRFYLSANSTLSAADVPLGDQGVPGLAAGETRTQTATVGVRPGTAPGTYFVIAEADAAEAVAETNERNNTRARSVTLAP